MTLALWLKVVLAVAIDDLHATRRGPIDGVNWQDSDENDKCSAWRGAWTGTDLRPVGRGLVGQVTVLLPCFRLVK